MNIFKRIKINKELKMQSKIPLSELRIALIEKSLSLFPNEIDISDGELSEDGSFFSNTLWKIWNTAEDLNSPKDIKVDFMIWAIFIVLSDKCKADFCVGNTFVKLTELSYEKINFEYIKACLEADLKDL